jgi:hypothetical protein
MPVLRHKLNHSSVFLDAEGLAWRRNRAYAGRRPCCTRVARSSFHKCRTFRGCSCRVRLMERAPDVHCGYLSASPRAW